MQAVSFQPIKGRTGNTSFLLARLKPGDVLLVLSAGDADQISAQVFAGLSQTS